MQYKKPKKLLEIKKKTSRARFLSLFGGLLIGIIVGSIPLMVPGLPIPLKLGFAAGL